jgi:hypothetical protein
MIFVDDEYLALWRSECNRNLERQSTVLPANAGHGFSSRWNGLIAFVGLNYGQRIELKKFKSPKFQNPEILEITPECWDTKE